MFSFDIVLIFLTPFSFNLVSLSCGLLNLYRQEMCLAPRNLVAAAEYAIWPARSQEAEKYRPDQRDTARAREMQIGPEKYRSGQRDVDRFSSQASEIQIRPKK